MPPAHKGPSGRKAPQARGSAGTRGAQGAAGPQGTPGPQGPQGGAANPAYVDQKTFTTSPPAIGSTPTVLASSDPVLFTSSFAAQYDVNATVTVHGSPNHSMTVGCYLRDFFSASVFSPPITSVKGSTPTDYITATKGRPVTVALDGALDGFTNSAGYSTSRIQAVCETVSGVGVRGVNVEMVMAKVSTVHGPSAGIAHRFYPRSNKRFHPQVARERWEHRIAKRA